jgi:gluconate 2-dehydrogenase subunit 3-like protein
MPKLKLPRRRESDEGWSPRVEPASVTLLVGRREFLKALGVVAAALATPFTTVERAFAHARGRFFTNHERATLKALCDRIIPPDADPGAAALGAARYIELLLTAFDHRVPLVFAGGPFSNRNPFPDNDDGAPSRRRPRDYFRRFIPLTRVQELRWRAELFGSTGVAGADFNDAALGPLPGLRDIYRTSLARVDDVARMVAGNDYVALGTQQQDDVLAMLDTGPASIRFAVIPRRGVTFVDILTAHTLEGCLAAPEYGGNRGLAGWKMIGLEGDDQPLGYSIFSRADGAYHERPDHPMSTPNPDELDPATMALRAKPLSADGDRMQSAIATLSGAVGPGC